MKLKLTTLTLAVEQAALIVSLVKRKGNLLATAKARQLALLGLGLGDQAG